MGGGSLISMSMPCHGSWIRPPVVDTLIIPSTPGFTLKSNNIFRNDAFDLLLTASPGISITCR